MQAEGIGVRGDRPADPPEADDAQGEPLEPGNWGGDLRAPEPPALAERGVILEEPPVDGKHQGDGVDRHLLRAVVRHVRHTDACLGGRGQVDAVEPHPIPDDQETPGHRRDQFGVQRDELVDHRVGPREGGSKRRPVGGGEHFELNPQRAQHTLLRFEGGKIVIGDDHGKPHAERICPRIAAILSCETMGRPERTRTLGESILYQGSPP